MARWRLINPHYLNVPGTEWEYKETDRTSGRSGRKIYPVPLYLDPRDAADHNYPGEIVVSDGTNPGPRDHVFLGEPTPDMEPLDDEARAISTRLAPKWQHPIESLPGTFSQSLISAFEKQISEVMSGKTPVPASPASAGVDTAAFEELRKQVQELAAQNEMLKAQAKPARRA